MFTPRKRLQLIIPGWLLPLVFVLLPAQANTAPSIVLSKSNGPPTSAIFVSGQGFDPEAEVDLYFDTQAEGFVVTNNQGVFDQAEIDVPKIAYPGTHRVVAVERNSNKSAQASFLVNTNWSQFHFDTDGTRFNPFENVLNTTNAGMLGVKWTHITGPISSAAAIVDGTIYFGSDDWYVYALNANTGAPLWRYGTNGVVESSPTVANGVAYVSSADGNTYALNASDGTLIWSYPRGTFSSPTVVDGIVYVGSDDYSLYALDAKTGNKLWSYATKNYVRCSPAVANGMVYIGSWDGNVYALNAKTGDLIWRHPTNYFVESPLVANGIVYVGSDQLYALDASTGAKIWSYRTVHGIAASPAVANGLVYVPSFLTLFAVDARTGALVWSYDPADRNYLYSSPAVANGVVYIGSLADAYALDALTGTPLWNYPIFMYSPPSVVNGTVYVGSYGVGTYGGTMYAFGLP